MLGVGWSVARWPVVIGYRLSVISGIPYNLKFRIPHLKSAFRNPNLQSNSYNLRSLARVFHDSVSRDREDERATGHPQELESEAYLDSTSQGSRPEDGRKGGHIHGRSSRIMIYPG
jgi:hypothetical protein